MAERAAADGGASPAAGGATPRASVKPLRVVELQKTPAADGGTRSKPGRVAGLQMTPAADGGARPASSGARTPASVTPWRVAELRTTPVADDGASSQPSRVNELVAERGATAAAMAGKPPIVGSRFRPILRS